VGEKVISNAYSAFQPDARAMGLEDAAAVSRDALKLDAAVGALEMLRDLAPLVKAS
jgi:hypothetical protein